MYSKNEGQQFTVLPAFVIMANQESAFWKNIQTGGEYLIDAITTLSGVGNLAKFRHLSKLAKLGHKLTLANKAKRVVSGFAAFAEISSGTINTLLKLSGLNDTKFGQSLSEVLFYLELVSLGGELTNAIRNGLKKASKEVLEHPNLKKYLDEVKIDLPNGKKRKLSPKEKIQLKNELKQVQGKGGAYGDSIIATSDPVKVKQFEEGYKKLLKLNLHLNPEKAINYLEDAMPHFNHKVVDGEIIQISKTNCGNTVEVMKDFIRHGKLDKAGKSGFQTFDVVTPKFGHGSFVDIHKTIDTSAIPRLEQIMKNGDEVVIYGMQHKKTVKGARGEVAEKSIGHYFYGKKIQGKLHIGDPQTGEFFVFSASSRKAHEYLNIVGKDGFKYLTVKN
ncbi:hypothetical protein H2O64_17905 [Kordia sp. YSTF-M3]|uniref:Uncharacterized protein n=1 Tax=Kordia aestuariivivens TaxID=2759037 RepID=A0ABR7QDB0_9FLAO|nr:hypothetical protein [Kordia aestuariivivens]MBC8756552.1 hypothetical protein [Kordia aestuariivivens]